MKRFFIVCALVAAYITIAPVAFAADCAPYYHKTHENSIGSKMADLFFLRFTTMIEAAAYGVKKATTLPTSKHDDPFCMSKALMNHVIKKPKVKVNFNLK